MTKVYKKIMFFCNVDWFLLSHRVNLIRHAVESGHEVHVVCLITKKNSEFENLGVTVHPIQLRRDGVSIYNLILNFFYFLRILIRIKPDILHCITSKPNLIGGICARFIKVPRVVIAISGFGIITSQNSIRARIRRLLIVLFYKFIFNKPNVSIIVQNKVDFNLCQKLTDYRNKVHLLLGSGVDLEEFKPQRPKLTDNSPVVVLFASRLLKSKGIYVFFEIARRRQILIKQLKTKNIEFWVAGRFDKTNPECISESELMENVHRGYITYKGDVKDVASLLNKTSVLILPTFYGEGLPKIICEAASCGVPVIATDIPGCRQGILASVTGHLIKEVDAGYFSHQLVGLLGNKSALKKMSLAARQHAEVNFDVNIITEKHFKIYAFG